MFFDEHFMYAASKAGLTHLSRWLAGRLASEGITSNTVSCGVFPTESTHTPRRGPPR